MELKTKLAKRKLSGCIDELKVLQAELQAQVKDGIPTEDDILEYQETCTEIFADLDKYAAILREAGDVQEDEPQEQMMY